MKKRLLFAALTLALVLPFSRKADAMAQDVQCFEENYGGGVCSTTCVMYNDQGSVDGWCTMHRAC
ncbi:MAG TPA: hypothetical protein VF789_30565 [Thermoanaerobaculia bacterium]